MHINTIHIKTMKHVNIMPGFIHETVEYFKKYNPKIVENCSDPNYRCIYVKLTNNFYLFACYSLNREVYDFVRIYKANTGYDMDESSEVYVKLKDDMNTESLNTAELNSIHDTNDIDFTYIDEYDYECELEKSEEDKYKSVYYFCDCVNKIFDDEFYPNEWSQQVDFHERFFHLCNFISELNILDTAYVNRYHINKKYEDSNNIVLDIKKILYCYLQQKHKSDNAKIESVSE